MSLRSILGGSGRVKKKTGSGSSSPRKRPTPSSTSAGGRKGKNNRARQYHADLGADNDDDDGDYLGDERLDDTGLVVALATDLDLRDTPQAMRYLRAHMFAPVPTQSSGGGGVATAGGLSSTRIAEELHFRRRLPPVATVAHVQTLLASPSAVEREVAELARAGVLRRIEVPRRGEVGETLILAADLERMLAGAFFAHDGDADNNAAMGSRVAAAAAAVAAAEGSRQPPPPLLSQGARERFTAFLRAHPVAQTVPRAALPAGDVDELFRAGFLTAEHAATSALSGTMNLYARPEAKTTLVSIERVSRQAAGSVQAVGGVGALVQAGGSSGAVGAGGAVALPASVTELRLAVPGNGVFLKLVAAALEHLVALLGKSRFREAPESALRERWDGGIPVGRENEARHAARRARGEFNGLLPGQTRKWKQFHGLTFEWVLREAVGSGLVEVFETGSVGRGVRVV